GRSGWERSPRRSRACPRRGSSAFAPRTTGPRRSWACSRTGNLGPRERGGRSSRSLSPSAPGPGPAATSASPTVSVTSFGPRGSSLRTVAGGLAGTAPARCEGAVRGFGFAEHGGLDHLRFVELPEPIPGPDEVRIRTRAAAFNRLDRFTLEGIPGVSVTLPHVLGSDGAGTVDQVGTDVHDLRVGTKVLLNPGMWDATCPACLAGKEALCR